MGDALEAGAHAVQLRDKTASARDLQDVGSKLLLLTRAAGALLFINDRLDVALAIGADGVHLGPEDIPVSEARKAVPNSFLIGTSTDNPQQAAQLEDDGADYIGCGTVYPTKTKSDAGQIIGLSGLDHVARSVDVPVIGIGGINVERSAEVSTTCASGIAVISTVMQAHQRYVPLQVPGLEADPLRLTAEAVLRPQFLLVGNGLAPASSLIVRGNERVLGARLADAEFFLDVDRRQSSESRREALDRVTFAEGLGSLLDRSERIERLTGLLLKQLGLDQSVVDAAQRAAHFCKNDLVSQMTKKEKKAMSDA